MLRQVSRERVWGVRRAIRSFQPLRLSAPYPEQSKCADQDAPIVPAPNIATRSTASGFTNFMFASREFLSVRYYTNSYRQASGALLSLAAKTMLLGQAD